MTKDKDPNEKSVTVTDTTKVTKDKDVAVEGRKPKPGDPDYGIEEGDKPDNTLPKPPGTPGHELPDREKPVDPEHGIDAGGKPDNTLPPEPGNELPTPPVTPGNELPPVEATPKFVADTRTIAEQLSEGPMTPEIAERLAKQEKK